jgi:hypothetical protein
MDGIAKAKERGVHFGRRLELTREKIAKQSNSEDVPRRSPVAGKRGASSGADGLEPTMGRCLVVMLWKLPDKQKPGGGAGLPSRVSDAALGFAGAGG